MLDVAIVGAGVVGSLVARELARKRLDIHVFEHEGDVAMGASKANSGIVHAGHDARPGSLKAYYNVLGCSRMGVLSRELDFPFRRNGSLVLAFGENDRARLEELCERLLRDTDVETMPSTMVVDLLANGNITAVNATGVWKIEPKATVLAMGCRERTRGALAVPGSRPAGVMTAGTAQKFVNIDGFLPGEKVVILGSGDIGLIMARRMYLEGAKVQAVVELLSYPNGLPRNVAQCVHDFSIPLLLSHTVVRIKGEKRLEEVTIARVDQNRLPIPGSETDIDCDTLLLSVGLIPENELSRSAGIELDPRTGGPLTNELFQTCRPNIFACGNVLHVHDLADHVSNESESAGKTQPFSRREDIRSARAFPLNAGSTYATASR